MKIIFIAIFSWILICNSRAADVIPGLSPLATHVALYFGDATQRHCDYLEKTFASAELNATEADRQNALSLVTSLRKRIPSQIDKANTTSRSVRLYGASELVYQSFNLYQEIAITMDAFAILERIVVEKSTDRAEVDPENWTGRIVNANSAQRSPCQRNDVSIVPT